VYDPRASPLGPYITGVFFLFSGGSCSRSDYLHLLHGVTPCVLGPFFYAIDPDPLRRLFHVFVGRGCFFASSCALQSFLMRSRMKYLLFASDLPPPITPLPLLLTLLTLLRSLPRLLHTFFFFFLRFPACCVFANHSTGSHSLPPCFP